MSIFTESAGIRDKNNIHFSFTRCGGGGRSVKTYHGRRRGSSRPSWSRWWRSSWEASWKREKGISWDERKVDMRGRLDEEDGRIEMRSKVDGGGMEAEEEKNSRRRKGWKAAGHPRFIGQRVLTQDHLAENRAQHVRAFLPLLFFFPSFPFFFLARFSGATNCVFFSAV